MAFLAEQALLRFEWRYFFVAIVAFVAEILVATTFSSIRVIRGSLSDVLVVVLVYFLLLAFRKFRPLLLAGGVFLFSCAIEMGQYFHFADRLGFRRGGLVSILLGNTFSGADMVMYALGCIVAWGLHVYALQERSGG